MRLTLPARYRTAVAAVRPPRVSQEQVLFDVLTTAAALGMQLPQPDINLARLVGASDPRPILARRLARLLRAASLSPDDSGWSRAGTSLARLLTRTLAARDLTTPDARGRYEPLSVCLSYAPAALALDCVVPTHPVLHEAWTVATRLFTALYPSQARRLALTWLDRRRLSALRREALAGRHRRGDSGARPGPIGRRLAVDPRLAAEVGAALGRAVVPAYEARYVFYRRAGDYFWPHPDDPEIAVNVFVCLEHVVPPRQVRRSAFVGYPADGNAVRHELRPGEALAAETQGLIHAREPVRRGERITLLAIAFHDATAVPAG